MLNIRFAPYFAGTELFALHYAGVITGSFTFEVIGGSFADFFRQPASNWCQQACAISWSGPGGKFNPGLKKHAVTPARQRLKRQTFVITAYEPSLDFTSLFFSLHPSPRFCYSPRFSSERLSAMFSQLSSGSKPAQGRRSPIKA